MPETPLPLGGGITALVTAEHRFGSDAVLLADFARPKRRDIVCDLGTGCGILPLLLMIALSAFIAALAGLFIGHFSNGLMAGIVYIKIVMILFLAPPVLFYLAVPMGSITHALSYLLPSSASFYGLMDLLTGKMQDIWINITVLSAHCLVWLLLFFVTAHGKRKKVLTQ